MTPNLIRKNNFRVKEYLVPDARKVILVFTAMGTKIGLYKPFVGPMNRKGYSCIVYDYPLSVVFGGDLGDWEKLYSDIIADAQARLHKLEKQAVTNFYAYGVSMGTLIANKLARDTPKITHVVLNLTYGDVAQNIWTYRGVSKAKASLVKQGFDEQSLRERVRYADPIFNAAQLKGKKVLLYLSKNDKVLVYSQTQHTRRALEAAGVDVEYIENKYLGHYLGGIKNLLAHGRIERFFEK